MKPLKFLAVLGCVRKLTGCLLSGRTVDAEQRKSFRQHATLKLVGRLRGGILDARRRRQKAAEKNYCTT